MSSYEERQRIFKQINSAKQVLSTKVYNENLQSSNGRIKAYKDITVTQQLLQDLTSSSDNSDYHSIARKFLIRLDELLANYSDYTYKVDHTIPKDTSPLHYLVKARESLTLLSFLEKDYLIQVLIANTMKALDDLLNIPEPISDTISEM